MMSATVSSSNRMIARVCSSFETSGQSSLWKKPVTCAMRLGTSDSTQSMAWAPQSYKAPPQTSFAERHTLPGFPKPHADNSMWNTRPSRLCSMTSRIARTLPSCRPGCRNTASVRSASRAASIIAVALVRVQAHRLLDADVLAHPPALDHDPRMGVVLGDHRHEVDVVPRQHLPQVCVSIDSGPIGLRLPGASFVPVTDRRQPQVVDCPIHRA